MGRADAQQRYRQQLVVLVGRARYGSMLIMHAYCTRPSFDSHLSISSGNLLGEEAENEAEEEELAATVGIHVRGDSVFRDEKLRDERDDSRFHWHR